VCRILNLCEQKIEQPRSRAQTLNQSSHRERRT
jgi:hypothetical protein